MFLYGNKGRFTERSVVVQHSNPLLLDVAPLPTHTPRNGNGKLPFKVVFSESQTLWVGHAGRTKPRPQACTALCTLPVPYAKQTDFVLNSPLMSVPHKWDLQRVYVPGKEPKSCDLNSILLCYQNVFLFLNLTCIENNHEADHMSVNFYVLLELVQQSSQSVLFLLTQWWEGKSRNEW